MDDSGKALWDSPLWWQQCCSILGIMSIYGIIWLGPGRGVVGWQQCWFMVRAGFGFSCEGMSVGTGVPPNPTHRLLERGEFVAGHRREERTEHRALAAGESNEKNHKIARWNGVKIPVRIMACVSCMVRLNADPGRKGVRLPDPNRPMTSPRAPQREGRARRSSFHPTHGQRDAMPPIQSNPIQSNPINLDHTHKMGIKIRK